MKKKILQSIIEQEILIIKNNKNNFFLTSNDWTWIFDFRNAFLKWSLLKKLSVFFWEKYENDYPFQIWWLELGSIPFISWIVMEGINRWKDVNSFFVRKKRKETWLWNIIEWKLSNEKIIIVDDLFNGWKSINKVYQALKTEKKQIYKIFVFINFWNENWRKLLEENNLKLDYEFSLSDFWLDKFWNSLKNPKEHFKSPMIFPDYQNMFSLKNSNKFLFVPKTTPIKDWKNIYFWGEWAKFVSMCSDTWSINWEFIVDDVTWHKNILSTPIIINNNIIFWSYDWNLYCLDKNNWNIKWIFIDSDWIWSSPIYSFKNNQIYIWLEHAWFNNKWSLVWIDFETWEKKWEIFFNDYVHCTPWYSEKTWIVICWWNDWKIIWVDWINWNILFENKLSSSIKAWFSISKTWKFAYFWCFDNKFYSIDLIKWKIKWYFKTWNIIYSKSCLIWNNIFFGSLDKYFYHLDIEWNLIKKIKTFWKIFTQPIVIENNIIAFGSNDCYIYFYDYKNKKTVFVIEHREKISSNLIYDKKYKHLYVYDFLNSVFKYNLNWYID